MLQVIKQLQKFFIDVKIRDFPYKPIAGVLVTFWMLGINLDVAWILSIIDYELVTLSYYTASERLYDIFI